MWNKFKMAVLVVMFIVGVFVAAALFAVGDKMKAEPTKSSTITTQCVGNSLIVTAKVENTTRIMIDPLAEKCKGG